MQDCCKMFANARRYVTLPQPRGGMCFCHRVGVLFYSFRYKSVVVCKNHDAMCESRRQPAACAAITYLSWWLQNFRGTEGSGIYRPVMHRLFIVYIQFFQILQDSRTRHGNDVQLYKTH